MDSITSFLSNLPWPDFNVPWHEYYRDLFWATLETLKFTAVSYVGAIFLASLLALCRTSGLALLSGPAAIFSESLKNLPLLTWLFILYYGLTNFSIVLSTFAAGALALSTFYGAYIGEIFRAAIDGIDKGQREAAQAIGLGPLRTVTSVVLPQAVRLALPGTATMLVDLLKGTSLLVTIAGAELMTAGQILTSVTFESLEVYSVIGLIYFALCYPTSQLVLVLERNLRKGIPMTPARRHLFRQVRARQAQVAAQGGIS
ncbi:MAG: amino acid ABC transporter permease [Pseudaminobacter sp.]